MNNTLNKPPFTHDVSAGTIRNADGLEILMLGPDTEHFPIETEDSLLEVVTHMLNRKEEPDV